MSLNTDPNTQVPPAPTKEEARTAAQARLEAAIAALNEVKKSVEAAIEAKKQAQITIDAAKPAIMMAEANVMVAKASLLSFGPLPAAPKSDNADIFQRVLTFLQSSPSQQTVDQILAGIGNTTSRDNLNAYLSRWAKAGSILKGEKSHALEPARFYAPPSNGAAPVPSFLGGAPATPPAPAPSFLTPTATPLPEDFPARLVLEEAGITTMEALKTVEDLTTIKGVGKATAKAIQEALEAA